MIRTACSIVLAAVILMLPTAVIAQACTWGGASTTAAPAATSLRSQHEFVRSPVRIAVDAQGNVYTADPGKAAVVVTDSQGRLISVNEGLLTPVSVAVASSGNVYVGERETGAVSVFDEQWNLIRRLGAGEGEFLLPNDIAVDVTGDSSVYVSDGEAHVIKVYDAEGAFRFSFGGQGTAVGQLRFPSAVHVSTAGEVYVADQNNDRVQVFDRTGSFLRCFGSNGSSSFSTKFGRILGITSDSQSRLYVADGFHGHVKVFDAQGVELATIGSFGEGPGRLRTPVGLAIDPSNRLWVASLNSGRLELFGLDDFADPHVTHATIDGPDHLMRRRPPRFISILVEIPGVSLSTVDVTSLTANGVQATGAEAPGDSDHDGIPDLNVLFPGTLLSTLADGRSELVVRGEFLSGGVFEGQAAVNVVPTAAPGRNRSRRTRVPR